MNFDIDTLLKNINIDNMKSILSDAPRNVFSYYIVLIL